MIFLPSRYLSMSGDISDCRSGVLNYLSGWKCQQCQGWETLAGIFSAVSSKSVPTKSFRPWDMSHMWDYSFLQLQTKTNKKKPCTANLSTHYKSGEIKHINHTTIFPGKEVFNFDSWIIWEGMKMLMPWYHLQVFSGSVVILGFGTS